MEVNPKELFSSWSLFFCSVSSSLRLLEAGLVRASVGAEGRALPKLATLQIVIGELKKITSALEVSRVYAIAI